MGDVRLGDAAGGIIKRPVGAREVEAGTRTFLFEKDGRYGTYQYYAEVLPYWERTGECWTNVQIVKLTVKDETLVDAEALVPHERAPPKSKYESCPRLRVKLPRIGSSGTCYPSAGTRKVSPFEYLHRIAAYAFPPEGRAQARFGSWFDFLANEYQGDHLADADLVCRPNLVIAGWVDPVLPAVHERREAARRELRRAASKADEIHKRLKQGPVRLHALTGEIRELESQRATKKRKAEVRELQAERKRLQVAVTDARALHLRALTEPAPILKWTSMDDDAGDHSNDETMDEVMVEFDLHQRLSHPGCPKRVELFELCRRHELAKLRVPLSGSQGSLPPPAPGEARARLDLFLKERR